jgi:hypothetical protein
MASTIKTGKPLQNESQNGNKIEFPNRTYHPGGETITIPRTAIEGEWD